MRLSIQYQMKWDMNDIYDHNSIGHIDLQRCIECEDSILMIGVFLFRWNQYLFMIRGFDKRTKRIVAFYVDDRGDIPNWRSLFRCKDQTALPIPLYCIPD